MEVEEATLKCNYRWELRIDTVNCSLFSVIVFPTTPQVELLDTAKVLDSGHFPDEVAGEVENLQLRQLLQTGDGADPEV